LKDIAEDDYIAYLEYSKRIKKNKRSTLKIKMAAIIFFMNKVLKREK